MKCPKCGGEIPSGSKFCTFCGSQITYEMQREQEQLNKQGCPKCGSSNVQFQRENQGEFRNANSKQVVHRTVGFCKDCGYTWYPNTSYLEPPKKRNTLLWVLGWIFFFPAPVMVLIWRKKNTWDIKIKLAVTVVFWIIFFIIGSSGGDSKSTSSSKTTTKVAETTIAAEETTKAVATTKAAKKEETTVSKDATSHIYDNAEIIPLKVGTMSLVRADRDDCTDEALADWFFNYVSKQDCNYHIIAYNDSTKGVYTTGSISIMKDIELIDEGKGVYSIGNDEGATLYSMDDTTKTISVFLEMADSEVVESAKQKIDALIPSEYKNSKVYAIDLGGEEGQLDCYITLVNESFKDADYQSLAMDLAQKIKDENLGIGYLNFAWQSDDFKLIAISGIDDLNNQDVSEFTTKKF